MMQNADDDLTCDRCDEMIRIAKVSKLSDRQLRFLDAYSQRLAIAPAARLAGVHRATVYRWRDDADFADGMRAAVEVFFKNHEAKVLAEEAARERWREDRARARRFGQMPNDTSTEAMQLGEG